MASAARPFRTEASLAAERTRRALVEPMLTQRGYEVLADDQIKRGTSVSQIITAKAPDGAILKMRVRLCWRHEDRRSGSGAYSAAQLRARLKDGDWDKTLAFIVGRERTQGNTHNLLVQNDETGFRHAALIPSSALGDIWRAQRDASDALIAAGVAGGREKNHAANGSSPTLYLQDDRTPAARSVADVLWRWSGVVNLLALPLASTIDGVDDTLDDLPLDAAELGRDAGDRIRLVRSGVTRDPKVREAVRARANGTCERAECGERRDFSSFLDVHHILGVEQSDRVWTCVALCPNCHREAHLSPEAAQINAGLATFAAAFKPASEA